MASQAKRDVSNNSIEAGTSKKSCGISAAGIHRVVRRLIRHQVAPLTGAVSSTTTSMTSPTTTDATTISMTGTISSRLP
jgi:hypothetical protein